MGPVPSSPRTRRVALAAAAVLASASALAGCTSEHKADLGRPAATVAPEDARDSAATELVDRLKAALVDGSVGGVPSSDPGARAELEAAAANVTSLRLRRVDLHYLAASSTSLTGAEQERFGPEAWAGDVQVTWEQQGVDRRPSLLTIPVVFDGEADEQSFVSFRLSGSDRVPLWLLTRLAVVRGASSVAVAPRAADARRLSVLAEEAVRTVRRTLPDWRDALLVQETPTQADFQLAAGLPAQQAKAVAAVTTTPDGSADDGARGQVFVNPKLFDPLGTEGRQIVVSHESAHVALGAATTAMPLWLSEGIADWVALRRSPLPVDRLASQVIGWVRDDGGPKALPTAEAFDGSDKRIGAWYEAAWLAVKRLADTYGAADLLRFYRAVAKAGRTDAAFGDVLGTNERAFVRDWRAYLESLA
jgi:hypothetical protein